MSEPSDRRERGVTRLLLLSHAPTAATRLAAFPADEPLDDKGAASAAILAGRLPPVGHVLTSPALRARQTVSALGLKAETEEALRDGDPGRWAGQTLDEVSAAEPEAVLSWLSDPTAAPHGGESVAALIRRVGGWLDGEAVQGRVLAVTHAAVARAAVVHVLGAPAQAFWRIDVPPLALVDLRRNGGPWTLRALRLRPGEDV
jgi:broad specificity phosphatase PhoE